MKNIIILGAGGAGYDIISIIHSINKINPEWNIIGFLDDNSALFNKEILGYRVLGKIEDGARYKDMYFVSSIANPTNRTVRRDIWNRVLKFSNQFATIIHPSVIIYDDAKILPGSVINAGCVIGTKVIIGNNVHIGYGCNLAHETILKDHVTLASGVNLSSGVLIGEDCYIGSGVSSSHDVSVDANILVTVGSSIVSNLKSAIYDVWIGNPAISMKEFVKNKNYFKTLIKK